MSHFYEHTPKGVEARHFVEMASRPGELRPTRITDVRKMWKAGREVVPSVTTILNVLDKAALVNWKVDQHLQIAHSILLELRELTPDRFSHWHLSQIEGFISECKRRTEIEMSKAPDAGTDIHKLLEAYVLGEDISTEDEELCEGVWGEIMDRCGIPRDRWSVEERFTDMRGFGGCADLAAFNFDEELIKAITPAEASHDCWVIDYKTKQTADKFKPGKMAYPDHSRQLAAYREGLGIPNARCANVFICIETGEVDFHEHTEEQLAKGWRVFSHALAIWQEENNYPQATQEAA